MPRTSGVYSLPPSYLATSGQTIKSVQHNPPLEDIAAALTASLPRDGSAPMLANISLNGYRITGLAPAVSEADAVRLDQVMAYSAWLSSVTLLAMEADRLPYATGAGTSALAVFTAFGRSLVDDADAAAGRATLGLGTAATTAALVKATNAEAEAGADNDTYMTPLRTAEAVAARTFTSADQVITAAGTLTIAHGLGAAPRSVAGWLTNTSDDAGYIVGQKVFVPIGHYGDLAYGAAIRFNTSNLVIRYGANGFAVLNFGSGTRQAIDLAKWTFTVSASL